VALTPKQAAFVREYLVDLNATQAAIRAGYSAKTASRIGPELLGKTCVQDAIAVGIKARSERVEITADQVLKEYARIALFDPRKLFGADGALLAIIDIDDDTAAAIAGIEVMSVGNADGVGKVIKIRLASKVAALDSVARHLGMFAKDSLNVNFSTDLAERVARAKARKRGE